MDQKIAFELVSPEKKLFDEQVAMAVIPGTEGQMGVMAGHSSFVVALQPGVVSLYRRTLDEEPLKIFIAGGFADVTSGNCTVLAEEAVNVNDLKPEIIGQVIRDLSEDLTMAENEADKARIRKKLAVEQVRLQAAA
jgi:F-type H+-transporting ATPase subunit epsilon